MSILLHNTTSRMGGGGGGMQLIRLALHQPLLPPLSPIG